MLPITMASASPVVVFDPSCHAHVIHTQQEASRDFNYLEFQRNNQACQLKGKIGGEHQTYINVLGFAGDQFSVSLVESVEQPGFTISGEGLKVLPTADKTFQVIEIEARQTFFSIEVFGYPYAEYKMIIQKH